MISGSGLVVHGRDRPHDRLDLHLVDLGIEDPQPAAARAEHRVLLVDLLDPRERLLELLEVVGALDPRALDLRAQVRQVLEELVQRRVEQPDRHRQPLHRLEQALEVLLLVGQQLGQRLAPAVLVVGHDHRPHLGLAVLGHEHVLGPAQADALGAQLARLLRVLGRVGVGAHAEPAELVGPLEHALEVLVDLGVDERDVLERHAALRAVDGDPVALGDLRPVDGDALLLEVDRERLRADHRRPAHAARHQRRVRSLAALGGEDPLGGVEAGHVVGLGERAHEDHVAAVLLGRHRVGGREHHLALRRPRRGVDAGGQHLELGLGVEGRVQQRVERATGRSSRAPPPS